MSTERLKARHLRKVKGLGLKQTFQTIHDRACQRRKFIVVRLQIRAYTPAHLHCGYIRETFAGTLFDKSNNLPPVTHAMYLYGAKLDL